MLVSICSLKTGGLLEEMVARAGLTVCLEEAEVSERAYVTGRNIF